MIPSEEIVTKVDAVTVEEVREAGRRLSSQGAPTLAAIGPIKGLPSLARHRARACAS